MSMHSSLYIYWHICKRIYINIYIQGPRMASKTNQISDGFDVLDEADETVNIKVKENVFVHIK